MRDTGRLALRTRSLRIPAFLATVLVVGVIAPSVEMIGLAAEETTQAKPSVTQNKAAAGDESGLLRQKAEQGDAAAQFSLGYMHANGQGVPQDYGQAVAWNRKAAEQGYAAAQVSLGNAFLQGKGVVKDYGQAAAWYRKAAEQGDAFALYMLGAIFAIGQGVPQDYVEAHKWQNLAAARATGEDQKRYADARDSLAKEMTPNQIAEAQKCASEWMAAFEKRKK